MSEETPNSEDVRGYQSTIGQLTRENKILRDSLLRMLEGEPVGGSALKVIKKDQIERRKAVLNDLQHQFFCRRDARKLGLVMLADPTEELEPQLGFDPEDYLRA